MRCKVIGVLVMALALGQAHAEPAPAPILTADQEKALQPKDVFKDCPDCPEMVVIPAGKFLMGSKGEKPGDEGNEGPQHEVTIAKPFAVGRFSITFEEWQRCVTAQGCKFRPARTEISRRPVEVTWLEAKQYIAWLSKLTGKPYRLLSEAEREYVTRAGTTTLFNTGDTITHAQAWYSGFYGDARQSKPVGSFPPNAFGVYDTHGNLAEWVEDCWHERYDGAPIDGSAWTQKGNCSKRVLRGGSWDEAFDTITSASRWCVKITDVGGGFRVARALAQ